MRAYGHAPALGRQDLVDAECAYTVGAEQKVVDASDPAVLRLGLHSACRRDPGHASPREGGTERVPRSRVVDPRLPAARRKGPQEGPDIRTWGWP